MTCYHPIDAQVYGTHPSGKPKLIFRKNPNWSEPPTLQIPCSQCIGCRLDRSQMWAVRCMHEAQMHDENQFITLTYNPDHLPQYGSLYPADFVNFMKRYRQHLNRDIPEFLDKEKEEPNPDFTKLRFFHGAEYGDELARPHHHACIFGHDFTDKEIFHEEEGIITYYSKTLESLWGNGFCTTSDLTIESAAYVARYCLKKINASQTSPEKYHEHYNTTCFTTGEIQTKLPEYATMSRQPGIGKEWYDRFNSDIFPHDTTIFKGKNIKTPRYYENLLRSSDPHAYDSLKTTRNLNAQKHLADYTPARLLLREKHKNLTLKQLNRKLHS